MAQEQRVFYITTPKPQEQIHARVVSAGDAAPFVFFLHQWPLSSRQFERTLAKVGQHAQAWGLDAPGYGMSPSTLTQQDFPEYARRHIEAIDALGAKTFVLVGAEIGVGIAAEIIRQAPGRATHLIAFATPPVDTPGHTAYMTELGEPSPVQDGSHVQEMWQRLERRFGPEREQMRLVFTEAFNIYSRYHWGLTAYKDYNLAAGLQRIDCPTLFVSAGQDAIAKHAPAAAALVKGAQHITLPGKPFLPWNDPDAAAKAILDFAGIN